MLLFSIEGKIIMNRAELIKIYNAGIKPRYIFFWGYKSRNNFVDRTCFSQWYISYFEDEV